MPYTKNTELPQAVQEHLPEHAQEIYREAFNNSWNQYKDPSKRRDDASHEEVCHRVAWSAVKTRYTKQGDQWVEKSE